jgi:hypothetical protein
MPACSRPATPHRMSRAFAGPGTIGHAGTSEAASVVGTTQPTGIVGYMPITTGPSDITVHGVTTGSPHTAIHVVTTGSSGTDAGMVTTGHVGITGSAGIIRSAGMARPARITGPTVAGRS